MDHRRLLKLSTNTSTRAIVAVFCLCSSLVLVRGAETQTSPQSAGDLVTGLYNLVSSTSGNLPDWDKVRACFLNEAVVVLRTSRTATTVFSLEGFIKDFVDFYERPFGRGEKTVVPKEKGFTEKVIRIKAWEYGEMAHVLVLYESAITGFTLPPRRGVDSFLLVRRDGRWLIAAITNELVSPDRPVPPELQ